MNFCYIQNKIIIGQEVHVEENIILEDYVEVKGQSIEISEEINEGLVMEEDPLIKIIVEENNEDPIIEKDLEVKMVETINWGRNWRGKFQGSQWNEIIWLSISRSFYFGGKWYTEV